MPHAFLILVPDNTRRPELIGEPRVRLGAIPRVGEYLSLSDPCGIGQAFRVVSMVHAANPDDVTSCIDLRVRHVGTIAELDERLNSGEH